MVEDGPVATAGLLWLALKDSCNGSLKYPTRYFYLQYLHASTKFDTQMHAVSVGVVWSETQAFKLQKTVGAGLCRIRYSCIDHSQNVLASAYHSRTFLVRMTPVGGYSRSRAIESVWSVQQPERLLVG
jgi:hypothetical protein